MKLSVIIPCKNEAGTVEKLLECLVQQTRPVDEVIVVNSMSTDDTVKHALSFSDRLPIRIMHSDIPGVAIARNLGGAAARGSILLFFDADITIAPNFIERFLAQKQTRHLQAGGFTQRMSSNIPGIRLGGRLMNTYARVMQYTPWPIAFSGLFSTKKAFTALKGFDPELFIMEDYDYALRAKRAHYATGIITVPFFASDRRFLKEPAGTAWKGVYAELYRYTHRLRVTKPLFRYEMGGPSPTDTDDDIARPSA